jgi:hypothetical protein
MTDCRHMPGSVIICCWASDDLFGRCSRQRPSLPSHRREADHPVLARPPRVPPLCGAGILVTYRFRCTTCFACIAPNARFRIDEMLLQKASLQDSLSLNASVDVQPEGTANFVEQTAPLERTS